MQVALIANGELGSLDWAKRQDFSRFDQVIAVDGGLHHCDQLGLLPDLIVGDFDSINGQLLTKYSAVPRRSYPAEKDETDLELALSIVGDANVSLFGASGQRIDHLLANLQLLARNPRRVRLYTPYEISWVLTGDEEINCYPGQTISLMPIYGPALSVTSRGLKWELEEMRLDERQISLSNVCLREKFTLSIGEGKLLLSLISSPQCGA